MEHTSRTLIPLRTRETLWRGLYGITHANAEYVIEVDYFDFDERVRLYRDSKLVTSQKSPARFPLEDGSVIEAAMSLYGMKVAQLVLPNGSDCRKLTPLSGTAEDRRSSFSARYPVANQAIAVVAWLVLAIALVTQIPNILNSIGYFVGFSVPSFPLPDALNAFLSVAGIIAGLDRGLRMKHNPLLDD